MFLFILAKITTFADLETLAKHGICLPPNMQGLTEEQIDDLKLRDEWQEKCIPSGGFIECEDKVGRRCGKAPNDKMAEIINRTRQDAKGDVSKVSLLWVPQPRSQNFIFWFWYSQVIEVMVYCRMVAKGDDGEPKRNH